MNFKFIYQGTVKVRIQDLRTDDLEGIESKSQWKKMIKRRLVLCDRKPSTLSTWVEPQSEIEILWSEFNFKRPKDFELKIPVVYEDEYLAILNKPAGLPTSGNVYKSLQNSLNYNLQSSKVMKSGDTFQTCHRLDFATSGLVLVSKTKQCRRLLGELLASRTIKKTYFAILQGKLNIERGSWNSPIDGKTSESLFQVVQTVPSIKNNFLSLVKLSPLTGRTHQLRIHSSINGHCIVGDVKYGETDNIFKGKGLFLCAHKMVFMHPITNKEITAEIDLPNKFEKLLLKEEYWYNRKDKNHSELE